MMTRRDWIRHMAALAAGTAALPAQIEAFTHLYEANSPLTEEGLIDVKDVAFGFSGTPHDVTTLFRLCDGARTHLSIPLNRRATFRWVPSPDCPLLATYAGLRWEMECFGEFLNEGDRSTAHFLTGTIRFVDQYGLIQNRPIYGPTGRLSDDRRFS